MPTALELTPKEWRVYIGAASRRPASRKLSPEEEKERELLLARIKEVATMLKNRFEVRRVILFGSLVNKLSFTQKSDVDIAVEGLNPREYWSAWKLTEEMIGDRPVDFVEIETVTVSLRRAIDRYGMDL